MSNDGDELSGESDISNNDGGEMGTRGEAELVLDTLSLLRKLNTTTRSGGAAEEDNIAGLLSVLSDRGLLKSSFEKLKLFLRVRDKAKLRQTQELLQSHLQLLQERSLALKKANIKTMERQEALLQKEKLILNLRTQLQEAKMKAVYAQENFLLDQLENEGLLVFILLQICNTTFTRDVYTRFRVVSVPHSKEKTFDRKKYQLTNYENRKNAS